MSNDYGIVPATGANGLDWPKEGAIPASYSAGGWTAGNEGFVQQTFLGASIRDFSLNGGFGGSSSSLQVGLVNDEYNKSDETALGLGDDVYHRGTHDVFSPPPVGTPVFFKFGKNHATIEQAWRKTYDVTYRTLTGAQRWYTLPPEVADRETTTPAGDIEEIPDTGVYYQIGEDTSQGRHKWLDYQDKFDPANAGRGRDHLAFGGILQSYTQNRGPGGNPLYSVTVVDPREILSNVSIILKNYAGTTFNNKNLFNVYGFLEYDPSDALQGTLNAAYPVKSVLTKVVAPNGVVTFVGNDMYAGHSPIFSLGALPPSFPITGQGFARASSKGIPYYRVEQALTALFNYSGSLPAEYVNAGFGGFIDFRGFKYVVDFSGIPLHKLPRMYHLNFDQIDLLGLAQELCDVLSHDLFVSLLPVIDHPAVEFLHNWNTLHASTDPQNMVVGVIRLDAINRSDKPAYGSIKKYIDQLSSAGIHVENEDVGFELSNVTTDKFIVGAQDTSLYFFSSNHDRDHLEVRKHKEGLSNKAAQLLGDQWMLSTSLGQEILPFYGFLGKDAVTIPRGWGSYQQILLDATSLNAHGVGNYYVTTEMELRCALVSYERWKQFLIQYNDTYMESMEENDAVEKSLLMNNPAPPGHRDNPHISNNYGVAVPRCVFRSDRNYVGENGLPASPCSPPYGYPLYFKRAENIGIPEAGVVKIAAAQTQVLTNYAKLKSDTGRKQYQKLINYSASDIADVLEPMIQEQIIALETTLEDLEYSDENRELLEHAYSLDARAIAMDMISSGNDPTVELLIGSGKHAAWETQVGLAKDLLDTNAGMLRGVQRLGKQAIENSTKVYNFVKGVAEKHLGKTFLVKVPKTCNLAYSKTVTLDSHGGSTASTNRVCDIVAGPFGFRPQPVYAEAGYYWGSAFQQQLTSISMAGGSYTYGALKCNYNPMTDAYEFNYNPDPQGGFFEFDLYKNVLSPGDISSISNHAHYPMAVQQLLCPQDMTNFISEQGRVSAFVRYDHSQFLNFHGISKESITQQVVDQNGHMVPDIVQELDNMSEDKFHSFNTRATLQQLSKSVAFVKCDLDDKFYMPPKTAVYSDQVFGRSVLDVGAFKKPRMVWSSGVCKFVPSFSYYESHFVPKPSNGGTDGTYVDQEDFVRHYSPVLNGDIIDTSLAGLDSNNVYCIITMPGRVSPTIDARMQDGPFQMFQGYLIKHFLTMDTVKGQVPGFNKPSIRGRPTNVLGKGCENFTLDSIMGAFSAYQAAMGSLKIATPEARSHFMSPSPVYPDMVALPLRSEERCYGPWISSMVDTQSARYKDIGGKVEFIKDENLSPWNFAGYQLMNEAGNLQAQFSNSLLLFSERGGFVFPDAPRGSNLGKALVDGGPLVTNVSVSVGTGGIRTTYKMDLYTARFGKLQKQQEDIIARVTRERQKMRDQQNDLIRKGLGKGASGGGFSSALSPFGNFMGGASKFNEMIGHVETTSFERGQSEAVFDVVSSDQLTEDTYDHKGSSQTVTRHGSSASSLSEDQIRKTVGMFPTEVEARYNLQGTAISNKSDRQAAASSAPNEQMAYFNPNVQYQAKQERYYAQGLGELEGLGVDGMSRASDIVARGAAASSSSSGGTTDAPSSDGGTGASSGPSSDAGGDSFGGAGQDDFDDGSSAGGDGEEGSNGSGDGDGDPAIPSY